MTTKASFDGLPLIVLTVLAIVLAVLGLLRLRSRDYVTG
jgi:hypothetical protein